MYSNIIIQVAVIEGTLLGLEFMSIKKGGRGGTIVNVASFGGTKCSHNYKNSQ